MTQPGVRSYSVEAYNISHASENKIHDDAVAQKLGFSGGLVPGVEVYGYMSHLALAQWGRSWLERGEIEARFLKPVYDGKTAEASARPVGDALELEVRSEDIQCATGRAALGDAGQPPPALGEFPEPRPPRSRPPADETSLAPGVWLASAPVQLTAAVARDYLRDVRERSPLYAETGLAHPGWLLRQCNSALKDNVALSPWIHTGSKVRNFAPSVSAPRSWLARAFSPTMSAKAIGWWTSTALSSPTVASSLPACSTPPSTACANSRAPEYPCPANETPLPGGERAVRHDLRATPAFPSPTGRREQVIGRTG